MKTHNFEKGDRVLVDVAKPVEFACKFQGFVVGYLRDSKKQFLVIHDAYGYRYQINTKNVRKIK